MQSYYVLHVGTGSSGSLTNGANAAACQDAWQQALLKQGLAHTLGGWGGKGKDGKGVTAC